MICMNYNHFVFFLISLFCRIFFGIMFLRRVFGRTLFAAAKSETSAAGAAAASTVRTTHNPLEEFFEAARNPEDEKPVVYGTHF